jgi:D-glycero-alpha-D-manno-heptose-7-phosphate kinase
LAATYGGFNHFEFLRDGSFDITSIILPNERLKELQNHLMLVFTGLQRNAPEIAKAQIENTKNNPLALKHIQEMVDYGINILENPNTSLFYFGELLHESWLLKRSLAQGITNDDIDTFYEALRKAGAVGGKMMGAGGGGFMLLLVEPERQAKIKELLAAANFIHVPFKFETEGSKVIVNV